MSEQDREHWDPRYAALGMAPVEERSAAPPVFAPFEHLFPTAGHALEVACGRGRLALWLARRGMEVRGVDISPVAIDFARRLADLSGVAECCRFDVVDLDHGLPEGPPADLVLCHYPHHFRTEAFDRTMIGRLAPGGMLAVSAMSEVDVGPGPYRVAPGNLLEAFGALDVVAHGEGDGNAWILARREGEGAG